VKENSICDVGKMIFSFLLVWSHREIRHCPYFELFMQKT
jgi:hypothetical protein